MGGSGGDGEQFGNSGGGCGGGGVGIRGAVADLGEEDEGETRENWILSNYSSRFLGPIGLKEATPACFQPYRSQSYSYLQTRYYVCESERPLKLDPKISATGLNANEGKFYTTPSQISCDDERNEGESDADSKFGTQCFPFLMGSLTTSKNELAS